MARKQAINSKRKTSRRKERVLTDYSILEEIIRVDHAGEFGATRIYDGQIAVFGTKSEIGKTIKHMADQEQEHIETFEKLILNHRVRPTALLPIWNVAGYILGTATAMMGEKAAMACTVAVEEVIDEHYAEQSSALDNEEKDLKDTIDKFRQEELEHRDTAIEHGGEEAIGYPVMRKAIRTGSKLAIWLSERF